LFDGAKEGLPKKSKILKIIAFKATLWKDYGSTPFQFQLIHCENVGIFLLSKYMGSNKFTNSSLFAYRCE
jgi:hypothetical protein